MIEINGGRVASVVWDVAVCQHIQHRIGTQAYERIPAEVFRFRKKGQSDHCTPGKADSQYA